MVSGAFTGLRSVAVNGTSLAYREEGQGEPVVFIHGSASDLPWMKTTIPAVAVRYRAIAYSRRYARPNEDIPDGVDDQMLPHVADLADFLRALDIPAAHLVGHSWGGFIALLAAIGHPELVRTLVLIEPPILPLFISTPPRVGELFGLLLRRPRIALGIVKFAATALLPAQSAYRRGDDERAMWTFGRGVLGKTGFARLTESRKQRVRDNCRADRAQLMGAGFPALSDSDVRRVRCPALLLTGEKSPAIWRLLSSRLAELLPGAQFTEIPGGSHLLHEEAAALVNAIILAFLAERDLQRPGAHH